MKEISKQDTPENKKKLYAEMAERIHKGDSDAKNDVVELLKNKSYGIGSQEKNLAIHLAEEQKMTEAVPGLYDLLNQVTIAGIGEKVADPSNALINIGIGGQQALLDCIEKDDAATIPYQTIAAILFHWFDEDKTALKKFLTETEKEASAKNKSKFSAIIKVVDNWK